MVAGRLVARRPAGSNGYFAYVLPTVGLVRTVLVIRGIGMKRSRFTHREVRSGDVTLAVRHAGPKAARTIVFLSGLGTPQRAWDRVISRLGDRYRVITYDYRGHGRSSAAEDYSFAAFIRDLDAVLTDAEPHDPVLCGWSIGADLAVWYAADHPEAGIAGVVAVDGGIPADTTGIGETELRRQMDTQWSKAIGRVMVMLGVGVRLNTDELLAIGRDADLYRIKILEAYRRLDVPVSVVLASRPPRSPDSGRILQLWRAGAEKLAYAQPGIPVSWVDSDHVIPLRRPDTVAELINAVVTRQT
jgi:esterase